MKFFLMILLLCAPLCVAAAQESGWADSAGYKQQILKTGAIRQVAYSPDGKTLYSVSADTLWHIHRWDAETGKLQGVTTIDKTPYKVIYSTLISQDGLTYSVCGQETTDQNRVELHSLAADTLLHQVYITKEKVRQCSAVFDSVTRILWVMFRTFDDQSSAYGPSGTVDGGMYRYKFYDDKVELLRSSNGVAYSWSVASGKNIGAFVGYYYHVQFFRGIVTNEVKWFASTLFIDSTYRVAEYSPDFTWKGYEQWNIPVMIDKVRTFITTDGVHYFVINNGVIHHWRLSPYALISTGNIPFIPKLFASSARNSHILFGTDSNIVCYHVATDRITDTITTQFMFTTFAIQDGTTTVAFGSADGYLRTKTLPYSPPNIPNNFQADITKTYTDSAITFSPVSGKIIARCRWDFGDGSTDTTETAVHHYATPGSYTVRLILTDTSGVSDTITKQDYITILPHLIPAFSATPRFGKAPLNVQFTDESAGAITSWKWDFGDGTKDTIQHPMHTYLLRRYYNVTLTISDGLTTRSITKTSYLQADTIELHEFSIIKRSVDGSVNSNLGQYANTDYNNMNKRALLGRDGNLYVYGCGCKHEWGQTSSVGQYSLFLPAQSVGIQGGSNIISWTPGGTEAHFSCGAGNYNTGNQIVQYRNNQIVTSFVGWVTSFTSKPTTMYFSSGRTFAPSGWTHNFDGAFLPDGTDVFLFRSGNSSSLQFFRQDSVLIARDSLIGDVIRPFASPDSQTVIVIANPYVGAGDSSRWIVQRTYSNDGQLLNEKYIEKSRYIRIYDAANIGWGEFLISGHATYTDTTGAKVTHAYLGKIGSDGRLAWEYFTPTWQRFPKLQKLSAGHYAAWGIPYDGFGHGFTAFRTDGTILADNRLTGTSNSFNPSDFVVGKGSDELWFVGSENVPNQGQRAAVYLCRNPMSAVTGVKESPPVFGNKISAEVFPLPASDQISVRVSLPRPCRVRVSLVTALGQEVSPAEQEAEQGVATFHLSASGLPSGVCGVRIQAGGESLTVPAVVVR